MDLDDEELKATRRMKGLIKDDKKQEYTKMSEEEKKAIETIQNYNNKKAVDLSLYFVDVSNASKIILNLIEKQQKELEVEKEKNKELKEENWIMRTIDKQYISKYKIREIANKRSEIEGNYREAYYEILELLEE